MEIERPRAGIEIIVVNEQGLLLLGKRKNCQEAGTWAFPGGHLEYGETTKMCAKRELLEETGLKALSIKIGPWTNNIIEGRRYIMFFMIVKSFEGEPKLLEPEKCEGWHWVEPEKLPNPLFSPIRSLLNNFNLMSLLKVDSVKHAKI